MENIKFSNLTSLQKKLLAEAEKAMKEAYNPYSRFYVGAAVLTLDDKIITGANFENAAYYSVHAEQTALSRANAMGERKFKA
ncbi:MAG: hypothetical protein PHE59_03590, partial [Patescibacteria group bacterium]|nr:hypothetical protein [Patescibacteria group bacterium]